MRAKLAVGLLAGLTSGCSGSPMMGPEPPDSCHALSQGLEVTPGLLGRGEVVDLAIRWETYPAVIAPARAVLSAGVDDAGQVGAVMVDVDVDLGDPTVLDDIAVYEAVVPNPFGAGTPPGHGSVLALAGTADWCRVPVTAVTGFEVR